MGKNQHANLRPVRVLLLLMVAIACFFQLKEVQARRGQPTPIRLAYEISVTDAEAGILEIRLSAAGLRGKNLWLGVAPSAVMPEATVGRFRLREATDSEGRSLEISRSVPHWKVANSADSLMLRYEVHLAQGGVDGDFRAEALSSMDATGARLLGHDVFLFPLDCDAEGGIPISYELPRDWKLIHPFAVGLENEARALLPDLGSLGASASALGEWRSVRQAVDGMDLVVALRGRFEFDDRDVAALFAKIAAQQSRAFGPPGRSRYTLLVDGHPRSDDPERLHYFGLHFDASMVVLLDRRSSGQRLHAEAAQILSHEFFHNWLGERVRQNDYGMNWFVEGATTWQAYQTRMALRQLDRGAYARQLKERLERDVRPYEGRAAIAEAGEAVLQNETTTALLYSGGVLLSVALDEELARVSARELGLRDLLEALVLAADDSTWRLNRESFEAELLWLSGEDFGPWLDRYAWGTQALPLPAWLAGGS